MKGHQNIEHLVKLNRLFSERPSYRTGSFKSQLF